MKALKIVNSVLLSLTLTLKTHLYQWEKSDLTCETAVLFVAKLRLDTQNCSE